MVEIAGTSYEVTVGSDVIRDGMYMEVADASGATLAEIFCSDQHHSMTFSSYQSDLPLPLVQWMVAHAKDRLVSLTPSEVAVASQDGGGNDDEVA